MLRHAEVAYGVDVEPFEVEHRVAAVDAGRTLGHGRLARIVGLGAAHDDRPVTVGDRRVVPGVEAAAREPRVERTAEGVDHVALEAVGRAEEFVDHESARECRVDPVGADRVGAVLRGDDPVAYAFDAVVDEALGVGQACEVAAHQPREFGIDLPDAGDESETDLVAQVFGRAVRRILAERNAVRHGVFENLLARGEHQGPDHTAVLHRYARQAAQPRAAQQIDEEGLDRVVGVVRHGHGRVAVRAAQLVEPGVAQAPRRDLHRVARALHFGRGVEPSVVEGHAVACGLLLDEHFVLVALGAAQLEVAVGHARAVSRRGEEPQHDHRVHAARYGEQYAVVGRHEGVAPDVAGEFFAEVHGRQTMFTSVSMRMPKRSSTRCCTMRAKASTSAPVAPPRLTSTSAWRSCTPTGPSA